MLVGELGGSAWLAFKLPSASAACARLAGNLRVQRADSIRSFEAP
jgi:hypothetical protein